ncbi:N-acetylmuramoyl-L-alanine amidase precursor [Buchnera aphidicola str. Ua (Uroleucon ambrosiae)]|uniref:N-acetylmuramoyl-L-alanine amidase n=1 Tax=Buchnera aphidicola str. Ua (Uroleucon ambrosiae) TaxID=1005057 RepID=G2LQ51_BUCUM|nr:N-acetylmuramoyl-L-alanine amidase precursor [Buchnera aphidicola str. Ua (Uroleucon ambrosiae)]
MEIIVDAGHGGQDPGAIGQKGLQEKKINIAIALKISKLLNHDHMFHAILTRKTDIYLSIKKRKEFFKKHHANLLISIHVDSSKKKSVSGASIWIISKNRMYREINSYLKKPSIILFSKQIENILKEHQHDIFLKKTILDLQSNDFKEIELEIAQKILKELKKKIKLHKKSPNYASLGILSSINIPSILIETGFITNILEEQKLKTTIYQNKIAQAIYLALKNYFNHLN